MFTIEIIINFLLQKFANPVGQLLCEIKIALHALNIFSIYGFLKRFFCRLFEENVCLKNNHPQVWKMIFQ